MKFAQIVLLTLLAIPVNGLSQLIGMEDYTPTEGYSNVSEKIYVMPNGDYDYQILDALDGAIYVLDAMIVYQEARRVIELNGGDITKGEVLSGSAGNTSLKEITAGIMGGDEYVAVRWDLPNGYHVYLNLQDLFCGIGITMDEAITKEKN